MDDIDPEFLHELRTSVRATRSMLTLCGSLIPGGHAERFAAEFRWLGEITTPVRDLDVNLLQLAGQGDVDVAGLDDLGPLRQHLMRRRRTAMRAMRAGLESSRGSRLGGDWRTVLEHLAASDVPGPSTASVAAAQALLAYRRIVKAATPVTASTHPDHLHSLRRRCKRMRYLLDGFASVYGPRAQRDVVSALKKLQDCLGDIQDSDVQRRHLAESAGRSGLAGDRCRYGAGHGCLAGPDRPPRHRRPPSTRRAAVAVHRCGYQGPRRLTARLLMKVVALYNIKGGVGKTSTAVNLAHLSSRRGYRTLLWDLDAQGAATYILRVRPRVKGGGEGLVRARRPLDAAIKASDFDNLDLLPADFTYRHFDLLLDAQKKPNRRLARLLQPLATQYDHVYLDCPPSMSLLSENVLRAADTVLVPLIPTTLSLRTIDQLRNFVDDLPGRRPTIKGFFSMVDRRKRQHREVVETLPQQHSDLASTAIPALSIVEQMAARREPVTHFAPRSAVTQRYAQLWQEVHPA